MEVIVYHILRNIVTSLEKKYDSKEQCLFDSWALLEKLTDISKINLLRNKTIDISKDKIILLQSWLDAIIQKNKPIQYVLGSVSFGNLAISVEPPVLIPRSETEFWVHNLIDKLIVCKDTSLSILDLCTGSGCIGLALAQSLPKAKITAVDISDKALQLAFKNKEINKIYNIEFIKSDMFDTLTEQSFDLIVSNPPYVSVTEWEQLEGSVKGWEDTNALIAQNDGIHFIEEILKKAPLFLKCHSVIKETIPSLWVEIGYMQGDILKQLAQAYDFKNVTIMKDQYEKDRVFQLNNRL